MEELFHTGYWISRFFFQRALGFIYLIAFLVAANQFRPLLGENGLLPAPQFLERVNFLRSPSIFHFHYTDRFFAIVAWSGAILSIVATLGLSDAGPLWLSMIVWFLLWLMYLSIVNIGQTFYGFGWESLLLETGFLAIFLGPTEVAAPEIVMWLLRWVLFRVEFGAGLIKMRGDNCWRDLTCLYYHHETQPLPNSLSWFFHNLPKPLHKAEVLFSHFVQLIVPWGLFFPQPIAAISGGLIIFSQLWLIISGNYSWLNFLTIILAFACFSDPTLTAFLPIEAPETASRSLYHNGAIYALAVAVILLSIQPVRNLFSRRQLMNYSFDPLHLVNTYGAFGSVTRKRYEIIVEGTDEQSVTSSTEWKEYEFKGKPGDPNLHPPQVAPYHYRLDWQMWFAAMSGYYNHPWFPALVMKLLQNNSDTLSLIKANPFPDTPPEFIRARLYFYSFTSWSERRETGKWWNRRLVDEYLSPVSLRDFQ